MTDMARFLQHALVLVLLFSSSTSGKDGFISKHVGEKFTLHCSPPKTPQDGVYVYRQLHKQETLTYYFKDDTFTPREGFIGRLETNRDLKEFTLSIMNVTVWDTGVYWCEFNLEDVTSGTQKTLLVVAGKQKDCAKEEKKEENTSLALIIVCVGAAFLMLFATVILLWLIPRMKRCCEHGNFAPPRQAADGVYEDMRGRSHPQAHTLINPAYQTSTRHMHSAPPPLPEGHRGFDRSYSLR